MHQHIKALTSLRFIAAAVVFLHHFLCFGGFRYFGQAHFGEIGSSVLTTIIYEMRYGVTLFFVLSGFLLLVRYYDSIFKTASFKTYWIKRFARIMPLYWTLLTLLLFHKLWNDIPADHFGVYYTLTQGFFGELKFTGLGTAWSLTVEECFYLSLPFLILMLRGFWPDHVFNWKKMVAAGVVLSVMIAVYWKVGEEIREAELTNYGGFMSNVSDIQLYTIFGRFGDFAIGMLFGLIYLKTKNKLLDMKWLADIMIVVAAIAVLVTCYEVYHYGDYGGTHKNLELPQGWGFNMLNALWSAIIIYFCCSKTSYITKALSWRPFVYLGEISFALYLVHSNDIATPYYYAAVENGVGLWTALIGFYLIFTIISALCFEVVERPCQHLILDKLGVYNRPVRRPIFLRALGMAEHSKPKTAAVEDSEDNVPAWDIENEIETKSEKTNGAATAES